VLSTPWVDTGEAPSTPGGSRDTSEAPSATGGGGETTEAPSDPGGSWDTSEALGIDQKQGSPGTDNAGPGSAKEEA